MEISCNFCGKSRTEAFKLIKSNNYAICDVCIKSCSTLLEQETKKSIKQNQATSIYTNPMAIKDYLDQHVIGQESAKIALSVGVANHYKRIFFPSTITLDKSNILLLGPTGTGKTFLVKNIGKYLNVPVAISDATSLTEAGYIGDDVEAVLTKLLFAAGGNVEVAQTGIVFIDEIDKISKKFKSATNSSAVGGDGVQAALLKMIEGSIVKVPTTGSKKQLSAQLVDIDTSNILFIVGGAFDGLSNIITTRTNTSRMGFEGVLPIKKGSNLGMVLPEDLIQFGMISEFVGRFPLVVNTIELSKEELVSILNEPKNNLIQQFKFYFDVEDIDVEFTDDALAAIADAAIKFKTGARSLRSIIEQATTPHNFLLADYKKKGIHKIVFTSEVFTHNAAPQLIKNPDFENAK